MLVILKNIIIKSLSAFTAISVLTLNFSGLLVCASINMSHDCCHITKTVKHCCAKKTKIIPDERISGHCGCQMKNSRQTPDLYNDFKSSNTSLAQRDTQYNSIIESGFHPEIIRKFTSEYSPPVKDHKYSYIVNLSLRI